MGFRTIITGVTLFVNGLSNTGHTELARFTEHQTEITTPCGPVNYARVHTPKTVTKS